MVGVAMSDLKLIGQKIKQIRKKRKISQEKLAEMVSMNHRSIVRLENAQTMPTLETLQKISKVLNVEIVDFFKTEYLESREDIIKKIVDYLTNASDAEVKTFYKAVYTFFN